MSGRRRTTKERQNSAFAPSGWLQDDSQPQNTLQGHCLQIIIYVDLGNYSYLKHIMGMILRFLNVDYKFVIVGFDALDQPDVLRCLLFLTLMQQVPEAAEMRTVPQRQKARLSSYVSSYPSPSIPL